MSDRLAPAIRRRGLKLGLVNAAIYSMGYALTTGAIVTYLAIDLGANGKALSLLLATPSLAGLLRLFSPAIIARVGSTKRTCIAALACGFVTRSGRNDRKTELKMLSLKINLSGGELPILLDAVTAAKVWHEYEAPHAEN